VHLRKRCEDAGLHVAAFENPFPKQYLAPAMLGLPERDAVIEDLAISIRNMGRAGIPVVGYHWLANPPEMASASWRTSHTTPGRGGARVSSFDGELAAKAPLSRGRVYTEDEMWVNYTYFIRAILPACEEAGVRLALHPDDPPIESLGGIPRLFRNAAGFERAMAIADSPASGLNLCLGNWTAMGADIPAAIRQFGARGQIFYGHAQGVQGLGPSFRECFLDEAVCDFFEAIRALNSVGFDGVLLPGHFPVTVGEMEQSHLGYTYAFGYLRGLIQAAERMDV
jgi:mannonate dehydratase